MDLNYFEFFAFSGPLNLWAILNSPFVTAVVIAGIGVWFERRLTKQKQNEADRDTERRQKNAEESVREQFADQIPQDNNVASTQPDFREEAKVKLKELKGLINKIAAADPDRRHHRVYRLSLIHI